MEEFVDKYIEAKKAKVEIFYPQAMDFINIDITPVCNLRCASCNHFIDSAPGKKSDNMSLQQVQDFIKESQELKWRWSELRITGGEPSLHPDFYAILDAITEGFKNNYLPDITLKIISNGTGKKVQGILGWEEADIFSLNPTMSGLYLTHLGRPEWLVVSSKPLKDTMYEKTVTNEDGSEVLQVIPDFGNVWQAPIDRLPEIKRFYARKPLPEEKDLISPSDGYFPPRLTRDQTERIHKETIISDCQVHATCGFELTPYGYTPCPCGGGRVVGDESIFFKSLSEITDEGIEEKLKKMCGMCGRNLNYGILCKDKLDKTEFWELILDKYKRTKPNLSLYNPFGRKEDI